LHNRSSRSSGYIHCYDIGQFLTRFYYAGSRTKVVSPTSLYQTFALLSAFILGMWVLPTLVHIFFNIHFDTRKSEGWNVFNWGWLYFIIFWHTWPALVLLRRINNYSITDGLSAGKNFRTYINIAITVLVAACISQSNGCL